ncbi:DUF4178 domain-containing protein [bacterium]|nr:DUF4178 domain-containing protein [bacterium]
MAGLDDGETQAKEVQSKALKCVSCGAPYTLRGFANTKSVACEYCGSIFDTSKPEWELIEKVERARRETPLWPLGQRATFGNRPFELIGWMERFVKAGGETFAWEEHLFFNPYHGFRYLTYQNGHFSLIEPLPGIPEISAHVSAAATYESLKYRHFSSGKAIVRSVLGEFPWRVQRGEETLATDYVSPPYVLSSEQSAAETTWSRGLYMTPGEVWAAVGAAKRRPVSPQGVAPNQPNPHSGQWWLLVASLAAVALWFLATITYYGRSQSTEVLRVSVPPKVAAAPLPGSPTPTPAETVPNVFPLKLDSRRNPATLEITARAGVANSWAFCECALVDTKNEHAYPFGVEVSYYSGVDGGESWSEGSQSTEVDLGGIPNGDYVLQVERDDTFPGPVEIRVVRDVPLVRYPCLSFLLITLFPIFVLFRSIRFESKRWAESDHAP